MNGAATAAKGDRHMDAGPVGMLGGKPTGPGTPTDDTDANGTSPAVTRAVVVFAALTGAFVAIVALYVLGITAEIVPSGLSRGVIR